MNKDGAPIRIEGKKVVLREKRLSDAAKDYAWNSDEELSRLDAAKPIKLTFQQALMFYQEELSYPPPKRKRFAIDTMEGEHIGNSMYYDINEAKGEAELGIMIGDRRFWGKEYGTDAVNTLLDHIFTNTTLKRVYLHTLDWNLRAQKSFLKAGFAPTRQVQRNGYDFIAMEIFKVDWQKSRLEKASSAGEAV